MNQGFAYSLQKTIVINKPKDVVYQYLYKADSWPDYLPHVKEIEMLYDDTQYQEFMMTVHAENGELLKVRSIRRCIDGTQITFFQPKPPVFLKHHNGGWHFEALGSNKCKITTYHQWNLSETPGLSMTAEEVQSLLSDHAILALTSWKQILDGKSEN